MELHQRIKYLRKNMLNLTQEEFSKKINVTRSNLGNIETNRINVTSRVITDICNVFRINECWLRTGEGAMEAQGQIDSVVELLKSTFDSLDSYDKQVIEAWLKATPEDRAAMKRFFDLLKSLQEAETSHGEHSPAIAICPSKEDKRLIVDEKRRIVMSELSYEEKGQTSLASIDENGIQERIG